MCLLTFLLLFLSALPTPSLKNKSYLSSPVESYFYFVGFLKVMYHFRVLCQPPARSTLYFCIQNTVAALPRWLLRKEVACQCSRQEFSPWSGKTPHATGPLSSCATSMSLCPRAQKSQLLSPGATTAEA